MTRRIALSNIFAILVGAVLLAAHLSIVEFGGVKMPYSLVGVYTFFQVCFTLISLFIAFIKIRSADNVGFYFLFTVFGKILVFALVYKDILFIINDNYSKLSILVPMLIYIALEAYYTVKVIESDSN